jgi:type IV secretion system protein VirD4
MAYFAGFGIQLWSILQDLNQLEDLYETRWRSFLANAGITQYFTPNDDKTAETISRRCGDRTVYTAGISGAPNGGTSTNFNVTKVPLIQPYELYDMPEDQEILLHNGMAAPMRALRTPYFNPDKSMPGATDYSGLFDVNPYLDRERRRA